MTWSDRKTLRQTGELIKGARQLLRINRDLLDSKRLQDIESACRELEAAIRVRDVRSASSLGDKLNEEIVKTFPPRPDAGTREWVEAILLAAIIAWGGVRTFFIQPFYEIIVKSAIFLWLAGCLGVVADSLVLWQRSTPSRSRKSY